MIALDTNILVHAHRTDSPWDTLLAQTDDDWPTLRARLAAGRVTGPMVHDARIAALYRHHGTRELWTADRDFSRFAGRKVRNPLVA